MSGMPVEMLADLVRELRVSLQNLPIDKSDETDQPEGDQAVGNRSRNRYRTWSA